MSPIDEQVVLVTGSTDGLGRALARDLAARASVLLHGRSPAKGEETLGEIRAAANGNERLALYLADFSSLDQVRGLAERILAEHDRLDVLVNNAGIGTDGHAAADVSSASSSWA